MVAHRLDEPNIIAGCIQQLMIGVAANDPEDREEWMRRLVTVLKFRCGIIGRCGLEGQPLRLFFEYDNSVHDDSAANTRDIAEV